MIYKWMYILDIIIVRLRKKIKALVPASIVDRISRSKEMKRRTNAIFNMLEGNDFPWMSPNIWAEIVNFYRNLSNPTIFEFGTGNSTMWHIEELLTKKSGTYIGIENDQSWFWLVVISILKKYGKLNDVTSIHAKYIGDSGSKLDCDVDFDFGNIKVKLRLRYSQDEYINSFDLPCDVVIIDGLFRRQCVNKVVEANLLNAGGLLMLMEAGRGSNDWWEGQQSEERDYSIELSKLLKLGGILLDGNGVDKWAGCERRSPRPISYYCPKEACKVVWPNQVKGKV